MFRNLQLKNLQLRILNLLNKNGQMSKADILNYFRLSEGLDVNAFSSRTLNQTAMCGAAAIAIRSQTPVAFCERIC